ncbi:hypothetical protein WN943_010993 [Citrus x changshan-huyou]
MLSDSSSDDDEIEMIAAVAIAKRRHKKSGRCGSIKVEQHDSYFVQKRNCAGVLGLSSLQKISAAIRMLAYGVSGDSIDEYVRIGESTAIESLKKFVRAVIESFSNEYLRSPNTNDIARLLAEGEQRGFPGMLGSLDYGIYPPWSTLVKTIPYPQENKHKNFAKAQESARKDVERAFRVLQARFAIVRGPARFWDRDTLHDIMKACVIMHNMIVEDEHITKDIEDLNDDVCNANNDTMERGCSSQKPVQKLGFLWPPHW